MKLTVRQLELLGELASALRVSKGRWVTPMECGGRDGSYHSAVLAQLCKKGMARRSKSSFFGECNCKCGPGAMFGHRCKGSFTYTITEEGTAEIEAENKLHQAMTHVADPTVITG